MHNIFHTHLQTHTHTRLRNSHPLAARSRSHVRPENRSDRHVAHNFQNPNHHHHYFHTASRHGTARTHARTHAPRRSAALFAIASRCVFTPRARARTRAHARTNIHTRPERPEHRRYYVTSRWVPAGEPLVHDRRYF